MIASRRQIIVGVAEFLQRDVIGNVIDVPLKLVLGAVSYRMRNAPESWESLIFDNPAARLLLAEADGGYDLDASICGVLSSLQQYGNLTVTVPAIPLVSKTEQTLTFNAQDVENLRHIIEGSAS